MAAVPTYRILVIIFLILTYSCSPGNKKVKSSVDPLTGIKTKIEIERFGEGGGIAGGSSATKRTITKYDKEGKIIYISQYDTELNGCLMSIEKWDVTGYNPDKSYQRLKLSNNQIIVQVFDATKIMVSENKYDWQNFRKPDWLDIADLSHY